MKHLTFPITEHVKAELQKHGVRRFRSVKVRKESYDNFLASIRQGGYTNLSDEQKHALAIGCCMTHPDHKDKHKRIPQYWYWVALVIGLMLLLGISARAQGTSQIDVITFQNSSGVNIKSFAAPFKIKCSTNITCAASGATLTMTASGGAGGSGYSAIQNAGVAIAAEGAINFLGVFSCVDNAGNASSDCKLSASAAVSHQFVTGTDSSGNYLRAQPAYSDISGTPTLAATLTNAAHKWLNSYDATTGLFTQTQPAYSDISGTPTLPATLANAAHKWFNSYDSTTGLFTQTQPDYSDLTGVPSTFAPSAHNLLSASHGDTTAASAVRGDGLFAIGATPTWQRLAHPVTSGGYFKWNGTDIVASSLAASGTGSPTSCTSQVVTAFTLNGDAAPTSTCTSLTGAFLPSPAAASLGGVDSKDCTGTGHVLSINTDGSVTCSADAGGAGSGTVTHTAGGLTLGQIVVGNGTADIKVGDLTGDATTSGSTAVTVVKVNGVAYGASPATDTVPVITAASTETYKALPNCTDGSGQHLNYDTSTHTFSCGTSVNSDTLRGCATIAVAGNAIGPVTVLSTDKLIRIETYINSYTGGGDTACLRFNNTAGTGYRNRWLVSVAGATTFAAGANVNASASCIKMGSDNVTTSRNVSAWVVNDSTNTEKLVNFTPGGSGTGSAATQASITLGNGAWVSGASTAITRLDIVTLSTTMGAGSGFCAWGATF